MKGVNAGVDMDIASGCYLENIATLLAEGKLQQKTIDDAVKYSEIKFNLGLFENQYTDLKVKSSTYSKEHLQAAKQ
jgi:beta-glucosidase